MKAATLPLLLALLVTAPQPALASGSEAAREERAAQPAFARVPPPPAPSLPRVDVGRSALAAAAAMPTHLATAAGILAFACSGEVIGASCGRTIEGDDGARLATYLLLATLPPLASGTVVWALGDDERAPGSLPWTWAGGAAAQLAGVGLAFATDSPAVAVLSLTALPVAGELAGLLITRGPAAPPPNAAARPLRHDRAAAPAEQAWLLPLARGRF